MLVFEFFGDYEACFQACQVRVFLGNIKGGVGKSTLCIYIFEMLRKLRPDLDMMLVDTDPQASSSLMLRNIVSQNMLRCMPKWGIVMTVR